MKKIWMAFLVYLVVQNLYSQPNIEAKLQFSIDSIYQAHPDAVGIMVHVEAPEKGISWSGASGYSERILKTKLDPNQPALIASSIKTYVSATILRLIEEKKITLDQSIENLVSKKTKKLFEKDGYNLEAIQVKHLLSHTSGIEDYANQDYIEHKDKYPTYRWTRDEQLKLTTEVGNPLGKPGEKFSYADANYLLLTEIIEDSTNLPFYEAMRTLLKFNELGIKNTWFPTLEKTPINTKELVHQYWREKDWDSYNMDVSWDLYGGGGIACPTKDLALFIQHFFNGNIVENDSIRNLIFTYIPTKETEQYPYYLGLSEDTYHGMKAYGHGGFWGTIMLYFPSINTSISVYILDREERKLRRNVLDAISKIIFDTYSDRLNSYQEKIEKTEIEQITEVLTDYIEGTSNGEPDRLRKAFHSDFNLYTVTIEDRLKIRSGEKYISNVKKGEKSNRVGRIISIDYEKNAATAKVEIVIPNWRIYTDYFLLLKYEGTWKIVQKSYTYREISESKNNK